MENKEGYVYILNSPKTELIKIGGSDYPPMKRIKEINSTEPYKSLGPWDLKNFRQVKDWRKVEHHLHYTFRSKLNKDTEKQKELFNIPLFEISKELNDLEPELIINKPKVDRMFQDKEFLSYLINLFSFTGLMNWLDIQGTWTFTLFPGTSGGRYFTLNIGSHEVAFSRTGTKSFPQVNMILVDKLIKDFPEVKKWIKVHKGSLIPDNYFTALPRATSIFFEGNFEDVNDFFKLDGVRRALIAYWNEALIKLKEEKKLSKYSKYHNWNAIAKIYQEMQLMNP